MRAGMGVGWLFRRRQSEGTELEKVSVVVVLRS
jgi:hypothetical protein